MQNDIQFFMSLFQSKQQKLQSQAMQKSQSSRKYWLRIMNECVRRRFLKSKQIQQTQCNKLDDFQQFKSCHKNEKSRMQKYMIQMQFYRNKFDTCIQQGIKARYPISNVQTVCGNKMVKFIRSHNSQL